MNIEYADTILLRRILDKLGLQPAQENDLHLLYFSPSSEEETPTLRVDLCDNTWHDADGKSGGVVDFVCAYLEHRQEHCSVKDALHWLKFNIGYPSLLTGITLPDETAQGQYAFAYKTQLLERGLIRYTKNKGVPTLIARQFLKQVHVLNRITGKEVPTLGLKNEEGGYAIYSPHVQAHIGPLAITFVRGRPKPDGVHVFKDIFDYFAALIGRDHKPFDEDSVILNSYACLDNAAAHIRGYGYHTLYTWFDNSETGAQVTQAFAALCRMEENMQHQVRGGGQ